MSYKYTILSDNPILYYRSSNISLESFLSYQQILNEYDTYDELESNSLTYNTILHNVIQDSSPCNNDGEYEGTLNYFGLPLISGESHSIKIDLDNSISVSTQYDYNQSVAKGGFATEKTSDNDFTLEIWFYPSFTTNNITPIMADATENIGLFYDKGNVTFAIDTEYITYTLPYLSKAYHLVAIYNNESISLYVDGELVASKSLSSFTFSNTSLNLSIGPTLASGDYFLVNGIAAYRYSLSPSQIALHGDLAKTMLPIQVVTPDVGELFEFYDDAITTQFAYSYPANKPWKNFLTPDLYYDQSKDYIQIKQGSGVSKTVTLDDFITIPSGPIMDDSRIEWDGENGITVQTSIDGTNYVTCINGQSIPQYKLGTGTFSSNRNLYIRIIMTTTNDAKYLPILNSLSMSFYNNQIMYAQNSSSKFSKLEGLSGVTELEVDLSNNLYPILSRHKRNGLKTVSNSGFYITTTRLTNTLEFFYTPYALTDSGLISSIAGADYSASDYSWSNSGSISKTNIASIYVNGVNKTSQTNVSNVFTEGELHHVVMVFSAPISNNIKFNHSQYGAVSALYQNVGLYEEAFDSTKAALHYSLYTGAAATVIDDSSLTLTENSVQYYNNDWLVYQTV